MHDGLLRVAVDAHTHADVEVAAQGPDVERRVGRCTVEDDAAAFDLQVLPVGTEGAVSIEEFSRIVRDLRLSIFQMV